MVLTTDQARETLHVPFSNSSQSVISCLVLIWPGTRNPYCYISDQPFSSTGKHFCWEGNPTLWPDLHQAGYYTSKAVWKQYMECVTGPNSQCTSKPLYRLTIWKGGQGSCIFNGCIEKGISAGLICIYGEPGEIPSSSQHLKLQEPCPLSIWSL